MEKEIIITLINLLIKSDKSKLNRVERQRKHQEMLEEHRNIKKAGLRPTKQEEITE